MKRTLSIALVALFALMLAVPAFAQDAKTVYRVKATKFAEAPIIDGELDDAAWLQAAKNNSVVAGFVNHPGTILMKNQTVVLVGWDDENLYLAYLNYRDMSKVTRFEDGTVSFGAEEENEFWFDYNNSGINSGQFAWDSYGAYTSPSGHSTAGVEVAVKDTPVGWVAEVKIPLANLLVTEPAEGYELGFIFTGYSTEENMYFGWTPTYGSFNNPPRWGVLELGPAYTPW